MEHQTLLILSLFSPILFNSANAICVHRSNSDVLDQPPVKIASSTVFPSPVFSVSSTVYPSPIFSVSSTVFPSPASQGRRSQPTQRQASSPHASPNQSPALVDSPASHVSAPSASIRSHLGPAFSPAIPVSAPSGSMGSRTGSTSESVHSLLNAARGASSDPKVQKICEQTDYPSLCFSFLAPVFNGKTDPLSVAELLIKAVSQQTKSAIGTVSKMASAAGLDQRTLNAFADCKEMYDDALDNFQEALDAIPSEDIATIQTMLSDAIDNYATCDDGFTGQPDPEAEGVSPMADIGEDLMNMTDNILAIFDSIP